MDFGSWVSLATLIMIALYFIGHSFIDSFFAQKGELITKLIESNDKDSLND
jgi:hypothetical protein